MTFIPYKGPRIIPATVEVTVRMEVNTNHLENVFAFKYNATPTAANLLALGAAFGPAYYDAIKADIMNNVRFVDVVVKDIGAAGRSQATWNYPANTFGSDGGSPEPLNVAASVLLKTAKQGRRFKGRKSISGFPESKVTGNSLADSIMALILRVGAILLTQYVSGQFTPAVASLPHVTAAGPPQVIGAPAESNIITAISAVDNNVDSQKTRLNGRGR